MRLEGSVALVTGANRGIGAALCRALFERGARKIYAAVRSPQTVTDPRLTPLRVDVTDQASIDAAATSAPDVSILVNNAGRGGGGTKVLGGSLDDARATMEVNYFGTWTVSRAFAPILAANGGGAIINVLSVASWWALDIAPGYSASKAAGWSLTNSMRAILRDQGTLVVGVHAGFVDTDFSAWTDAPKISADSVAAQTMAALENDADEVLADDFTRDTRAALSGDIAGVHRITPW
ncbi:SDR family oxidoreductase [Actinopolymorpha pittospori]|uniref:NAD(P)-dependent dehydrogenase (Short-subunit alcohol dehydrogenase family) n=1 Tax=Actinopolymorpha pittospori TaxID=648752 RepID=A0A927RMS8_9ACTN|nr:SDR family oxidoreductase [Actinopolymorpha pittospori]MBE1609273.1 NAD(P)-dependent dehydrogenase (short-subunit alcohol dehydrogenase family) [Actinopolymorpha pittospori]